MNSVDRKREIEKVWDFEDFKCVVMIHPLGHRCGYVGIPKNHILYDLNYHDKPEFIQKHLEKLENSNMGKRGIIDVFFFDGEVSIGFLFDVHGGITYSGGGENSQNPIESNLWWFGYDCAHSGDASMYEDLDSSFYDPTAVVRTLDYCIKECENLATQIKEYFPEANND